eukprot:5123913-Amphidinium_carterae.1
MSTTATSRSRAMRHSQAQQLKQRRRAMLTPPCNVQPRVLVARDCYNDVELVVAQRVMTLVGPKHLK